MICSSCKLQQTDLSHDLRSHFLFTSLLMQWWSLIWPAPEEVEPPVKYHQPRLANVSNLFSLFITHSVSTTNYSSPHYCNIQTEQKVKSDVSCCMVSNIPVTVCQSSWCQIFLLQFSSPAGVQPHLTWSSNCICIDIGTFVTQRTNPFRIRFRRLTFCSIRLGFLLFKQKFY